MNVVQQIPILNVSSLADSFAWFEKIGWDKRWDWGDPPDFGAVGNGGFEIFLCLDCQGQRGEGDAGSWAAWMLPSPADVDAAYERAVGQGLTVTMPPTDQPWNLREFCLRHPDGHTFRIGAPIEIEEWIPPTEPRLPIERVDVTLRLEKRLAALLADLARHKRMTVSECLEETLLHTFEPLGGGVASPHTPAQIAHIQELKRRHGIDYDCHASYRFVERG
ncbi:MAG TPA: VOC family protein [Gemmatimonadales bacterium]|nr:VOC family protein [Gemmatimonadales bacterium]